MCSWVPLTLTRSQLVFILVGPSWLQSNSIDFSLIKLAHRSKGTPVRNSCILISSSRHHKPLKFQREWVFNGSALFTMKGGVWGRYFFPDICYLYKWSWLHYINNFPKQNSKPKSNEHFFLIFLKAIHFTRQKLSLTASSKTIVASITKLVPNLCNDSRVIFAHDHLTFETCHSTAVWWDNLFFKMIFSFCKKLLSSIWFKVSSN